MAGKTAIGEAVGGRPDGFLEGADRPLHDMDMFVGGAHVKVDGAWKESETVGKVEVAQIVVETGKFVVGVESADSEATPGIKENFFADCGEDGPLRAVLSGNATAETDVFGDEVKKCVPLDEEEVGTQGDGAVVLFDERGQWRGDEGGSVRDWWTLGLLALEEGNVGTINEHGTFHVCGRDRGVSD